MLESVHNFCHLHSLMELGSIHSLPRLEVARLGGCALLSLYTGVPWFGVNVKEKIRWVRWCYHLWSSPWHMWTLNIKKVLLAYHVIKPKADTKKIIVCVKRTYNLLCYILLEL